MDHSVSQIDPLADRSLGLGNLVLPMLLHIACHDQ
jgi:hypothetical protein